MLIDEQALRRLIADEVRRVLREELRPHDDYLDVATAAEVASVTPQTIRGWIREGKLHGYRAGREWRVRRPDLDDLLTSSGESVENPHDAALRLVNGGRRR